MASQEDQQTYILQSVAIGGQEFDLSMITFCAYIEPFDLSGPKLILKFHDRYAYLRDQLDIKEFDEIEVTLADPFHQDGIDEKQKFTILTLPVKEGVFTINAMQSDIFKGKRQCGAENGMAFTNKSMTEAISDLLPGVEVKSKGSLPTIDGYYLSPTDKTLNTPCKLMRRIAAEYGYLCFYGRDRLNVFKLSELTSEEEFDYVYDDPTQDNQIHDYRQLNVSKIAKQKVEFNYRGFDTVRGRIKGTAETDSDGGPLPVKFSGITDESKFENMTVRPWPLVDLVTLGNGFLQPGKIVNITWNVPNKDAPIDESLPDRVIVGAVTHLYTPQRYYCRFRGIQWPES